MVLIKRMKQTGNMELIKELVEVYFSYIKEHFDFLNGAEISELLRFSMCKCLGLSTVSCVEFEETFAKGVIETLNNVLVRYKYPDASEEYKMGLLEGCVHCMEMARKKAGV